MHQFINTAEAACLVESVDTDIASERFGKERRVSLIFAWGLGFLSRTAVWYTGLPRHPGIKTSGDVFS